MDDNRRQTSRIINDSAVMNDDDDDVASDDLLPVDQNTNRSNFYTTPTMTTCTTSIIIHIDDSPSFLLNHHRANFDHNLDNDDHNNDILIRSDDFSYDPIGTSQSFQNDSHCDNDRKSVLECTPSHPFYYRWWLLWWGYIFRSDEMIPSSRTNMMTHRTTTTCMNTRTSSLSSSPSCCCCCCCCCCRPFHQNSCTRCWYNPTKLTRYDTYLLFGLTQNGCCCIQPQIRQRIRQMIHTSIVLFMYLLILLWLGVEYEQYHVRNANDTNLQQPSISSICGIIITTTTPNQSSGTTTSIPNFYIESYPSVETFHETVANASINHTNYNNNQNDINNDDTTTKNNTSDSTINTMITAHCGNCGSCSNPFDIQVYDTTKTTLFPITTKCAKYGLLWGRKTARKCMIDHVDLTYDCNECWVENIMCDLRKCIFTCFWYGLFSEIDGSDSSGSSTSSSDMSSNDTTSTDPTSDLKKSLNPCTTCDEKRCGPQFLQCAGANRRRCGILSDIERHNDVCTLVDPQQWWTSLPIQEQYRTFIQT